MGKGNEKGPYQEKQNWYLVKLITIINIELYDSAAQDWITEPDIVKDLVGT